MSPCYEAQYAATRNPMWEGRRSCTHPAECNNNNNISLLQTHGPYTYKKMLNIYKNSNKKIII